MDKCDIVQLFLCVDIRQQEQCSGSQPEIGLGGGGGSARS